MQEYIGQRGLEAVAIMVVMAGTGRQGELFIHEQLWEPGLAVCNSPAAGVSPGHM